MQLKAVVSSPALTLTFAPLWLQMDGFVLRAHKLRVEVPYSEQEPLQHSQHERTSPLATEAPGRASFQVRWWRYLGLVTEGGSRER